jgi:hypothetical protein
MTGSFVRRIFNMHAAIPALMLVTQSRWAQNPGFIWNWGNIVGGSGASFVPFRPNPLVEVSPDSLDFGKAAVGGTTAAQSVNITNLGFDDLNVVSLAISSGNSTDFTVSGPSLPVTVKKDESIAVSVKFTPTASGARNSTLIVGDNGFKGPHTISLSGTAVTIGDLITAVETLSLNPGEINSLLAKLRAAQQSLARDDPNASRNQLGAFVTEVTMLKDTGRLPASVAQDLIELAQIIINSIPA